VARVQSLKLTSYCESCECVEFYHHSFFHLSGAEIKKQFHFLAIDLVIKKSNNNETSSLIWSTYIVHMLYL